ncbi:hypothetical protein PC110_g4261 [Phytophthora cactorum]|uniref:ZSWIM1/3 RNaseH-like domain-containing protein n=3 Tax=Phytophthora cactorum TaxID=29920 RepID=A0A329SVH6_9STRA|nr:hypothetical protein C6341_g22465 [Phytophthora cactorum]RAW39542.1 hypothetical protein PC110_g4261 [Phytophthora cactorum]
MAVPPPTATKTESVGKRNRQLKDSMRAKDGRPVRYLPDDQPRWRRRYICTHVWPDHSRGKGERPQQMLRSTLFPFHFTTRVFTSKGRGTWRSVTHNHSLSREVYDNYSHNRQVPMKEPIVEDLHLMVKASGKCLRIYEYIRDHSAYRVTRRDVTNLMVTIRSVLRGEVDDDLAVDKFLLDIEQDDPGIVTSVNDTSTGEAGAVSPTTSHMRRLFVRFPEILLVDCSHKTNRYHAYLIIWRADRPD